MFSHQCHMTQPKIAEWFANMGILISDGQISHFLTEGHAAYHREKEEIVGRAEQQPLAAHGRYGHARARSQWAFR